jgi:hypothetical protein
MRKQPRIVVTACIAILSLVACSRTSAPRKVLFEVQQRCAKDAQQWFRSKYGNATDERKVTHYSNHFKDARCYVLLTSVTYSERIENGERVKFAVDDESLSDVEDNRQLGVVSKGGPLSAQFFHCVTDGQRCDSVNDWIAFEKRHMEQ